jgi:phospholipid-binding lipoprotein MlaA
MRTLVALPVNSLGSPLSNVSDVPVRNSLTVLNAVNQRSKMLEPGKLVDDIALDKYVFIRDVYLQRRKRSGADGGSTEVSEEDAGTGGGRDAMGSPAP